MHLTARIPKRRPLRTRQRRTQPPAQHAHPKAARATDDARRGLASQDKALYSCMCGYAFTAAVTTSVGCPHCGTEQAW